MSNMRIMGIDPSKTCTGVVVLDGERPDHWGKHTLLGQLKKTHSDDISDGLEKARKLGQLLDSHAPDLVILEGFAFSNTNTLTILVKIRTCLEIALRMRKIPYVIVAPSQVTKFVVAGTHRKKEDVKLHAFKRWGFEDRSNDVTDAFCLAQIGWAWEHEATLPLKLTKPQTEVIEKLSIAWTGTSPSV